MPQTISFLNRKGGTGKTTTAVNVALALIESGITVSLIVTDRNYTAESLQDTIKESNTFTGLRKITVRQVLRDHDHLLRALYGEARQPDYYIIDGAPNLPSEVYSAIAAHSDTVILPTNSNPIELEPTAMTLGDIAASQHPGLKVALLATRIHPRTALATVQALLEPLETPVIPFFIPHYKAFGTVPCDTGQVFREATQHILAMDESYIFARHTSENAKRDKVLHILFCEVCGKQFSSSRAHSRTCGDSCRKALSRTMHQDKGNLVQVI